MQATATLTACCGALTGFVVVHCQRRKKNFGGGRFYILIEHAARPPLVAKFAKTG